MLEECEAAAANEGFARLELKATRSGRPLYEAAGFVAIEDVVDVSGGAPVPLTRMGKPVTAATADRQKRRSPNRGGKPQS